MDRLEMGCMFGDEAVEARRRRFGHVLLWDRDHRRILRLEVAGRGTGGEETREEIYGRSERSHEARRCEGSRSQMEKPEGKNQKQKKQGTDSTLDWKKIIFIFIY